MQLSYQIISTPLGEILVAGTDLVITHVKLGTDKRLLGAEFMMEHEVTGSFGRTDYVQDACYAIVRYLHGETQAVDVAIQVEGTDFQRKVWQELRQVPYGKTVDYLYIAEAIESPDAVRAVANACASNPMPLIIPCHRIIHKDGSISGFVWGTEAKQFLLDMEKTHAASFALA